MIMPKSTFTWEAISQRQGSATVPCEMPRRTAGEASRLDRQRVLQRRGPHRLAPNFCEQENSVAGPLVEGGAIGYLR